MSGSIGMNPLFGRDFQTLAAALAAREQMQSVFATNIANADTPNYKADARRFEDFLARQMRSTRAAGASGSSELARTAPGHMAAGDAPPSPWLSLSAGRSQAMERMDGNTVNVQKEMAGMAENQLMHELTVRLLKGRLSGLSKVIQEGGR